MRAPLALVAILALSSPAAAQTLPDWLDADGRITLGYSNRAAGADAFIVGDATFRFTPGLFGPVGLELGLFGRADALDTPHETYAALTWDFGDAGRLAFGEPRPAYDLFAVSALETSFPSLAIDRTGTTRSAATFGAMYGNWLPYGARFSNQTDRLRYAVSVHHASNVDRTVAGLGLATDAGDWQLSGAVEVVWGGAGTEVGGKVQARTRFDSAFGPVTAGAGYYAPAVPGASDMVEFFASGEVSDRFGLSGVVQVPVDGATDPTAGISARYRLRSNLGLSIGVATDPVADTVWNGFLDFTF